MSGPWDRQPSPEPDDEWPTEDLGRRDPWSTADPSRDASRDAGPGWDDWPAPPPPADDYLIQEPLAPSSDPWAESWTDEAPSGPAPTWSGERSDVGPPRVEPWYPDADPWGLPAGDSGWGGPSIEPVMESAPPSTGEGPVYEEPVHEEPVREESVREEPVAEAPLEEVPVEAGAPEPPQVAWSPPEGDAWSAPDEIETDTNAVLPDQATDADADAAGSGAWSEEPPSIFRVREPEPEPPPRTRWFAPAETAGEAVDTGWRRSIFPEPEVDLEPEPEPKAELEAEPRPEAELEPEPTAEPEAEAFTAQGIASPADGGEPPALHEGEPWPEPDSPPESEPAAPSRFNPLRWLSGRGAAKPDREPEPVESEASDVEPVEPETADAEAFAVGLPQAEPVDAAAEENDEARAEPEASGRALPVDAWEPDTTVDWQPAAEAEAEAKPDVARPLEDDRWSDAWPEADAAAVGRAGGAAEAEPFVEAPTADAGRSSDDGEGTEEEEPTPAEAPPRSSWAEPAWRSEPFWSSDTSAGVEAPGADAAESPADAAEPEPAWSTEPRWPEMSESTQVLPSTWAPTVPEPRPAEPSLAPSAGEIRTRLATPDTEEDAETATSTAEQAVPWLIGVILLLAGMVIVLLALIFAGDASLAGGQVGPSSSAVAVLDPDESAAPSVTPTPIPTAVPTVSVAPSVSVAPTPTPLPIPDYGPLEMVYQGRSAALAAIYLLHRDFTTEDEPEVLAQDATLDVRRFAWSPDGRHGAGLLADVVVSIEPGNDKRRLADGIQTIAFGEDPAIVYAVRVTQDGANDVASVLAIDFASGDTTELASVSYVRPSLGSEAAVNEAQFADDGGAVRLYWMHDDTLRLWALGAGAWTIDPTSGEAVAVDNQEVPWLWDPDGRHRIAYTASEGTTTLTYLDRNGGTQATTEVTGLVSHLRWSPDGKRAVFTVGRSTSNGGVLQDLFLWDLGDGDAPVQITNTGAAFGAQWLGTMDRFQEATPDA